MKKIALLLLSLVFVLGSCAPKTTRVLLIYEGAGHHKDFSDAVLPWLRSVAEEEHLSLTEITRTKVIDDAYLSGFDVVVQLDYAPYGWPDEAFAAFERYIAKFYLPTHI